MPIGCSTGHGARSIADPVDKKALSERDICTKFITPAIAKGGWDVQVQVRENVHLTKGRVIVRGKLVSRGTAKFADYVLYAKPNANIPLAIVEAKDNNHGVGEGRRPNCSSRRRLSRGQRRRGQRSRSAASRRP
jgi:type I site-specific restriction endonuclease